MTLDEILVALETYIPVRQADIQPRWQGGTLILKPGNDSQPKEIPIEQFFKKIIGIRESLRVLEQKINNHGQLSQEDKVSLQSYITRCYGSLTSFNILFRNEGDRFVGSTTETAVKLTPGEAKRRLGLNEY